ncbi:MAG: LegC family aminotransferase [Negativicutes bacterium]
MNNGILDYENIIAAIQRVVGGNSKMVALHEPAFQGNEWAYVKECIDTGWVSSVGSYVDRFERDLAEVAGVRRAVATVNGTAALHISCLLAGVEPGDEVLTPALTFIATTNAVSYCGAIPHFVDSEMRTLGMNPDALSDYLSEVAEVRRDGCYNKQTGRRIRAAVPMHTFGHPVDIDAMVDVCERFNIVLVEDAAESLGSVYKGRHTGQWGKVSALSFNGNKIVTTGGGGAILTNDEKLGALAKHLTTTAKLPHRWEFNHDRIGFNYRLPNINAALGCAQLEQLPRFIEQKRKLTQKYIDEFQNVFGVSIFQEQEFARSNYWLNVMLLTPEFSNSRDLLLEKLNENKLQSRPVWTLMYRLPIYSQCPRMQCPVVEDISDRLINIPSSACLAGVE